MGLNFAEQCIGCASFWRFRWAVAPEATKVGTAFSAHGAGGLEGSAYRHAAWSRRNDGVAPVCERR